MDISQMYIAHTLYLFIPLLAHTIFISYMRLQSLWLAYHRLTEKGQNKKCNANDTKNQYKIKIKIDNLLSFYRFCLWKGSHIINDKTLSFQKPRPHSLKKKKEIH